MPQPAAGSSPRKRCQSRLPSRQAGKQLRPKRGRWLASLVLRQLRYLTKLGCYQSCDRLGVREEFAQELQVFAHQNKRREEAGYVAAGAGVAGHKTKLDRVLTGDEHQRNV